MPAILVLVILILMGAIIYLGVTTPKIAELGRIVFGIALLVLLLNWQRVVAMVPK